MSECNDTTQDNTLRQNDGDQSDNAEPEWVQQMREANREKLEAFDEKINELDKKLGDLIKHRQCLIKAKRKLERSLEEEINQKVLEWTTKK